MKGAKFEDVAKRESADTVSGATGRRSRQGRQKSIRHRIREGRLRAQAGEISQPVLTPFGFHIIRVDSKKGDTLALRHILVRIQQSDTRPRPRSTARRTQLVEAGGAERAGLEARLRREAAQASRSRMHGDRGRAGRARTASVIPSVSAWAFGGAKAGETSELFDDENGYYLARLDSTASKAASRSSRT